MSMEDPKRAPYTEDIPFRELREVFDGPNSFYYELPERPDLLVKRTAIPIFVSADESGKRRTAAPDSPSTVESMKRIGKSFNIPFVDTHPFIGKDPRSGQPSFFLAVDRIDGEDLSKIEKLSLEQAEELDRIYSGVFEHYRDSFLNRSSAWLDFRNDQIMYGTTRNDPNPHFYVADTDPYVFPWEDSKDPDKDFWERVMMVFQALKESETKYSGKGVKFADARASFEKIKRDIPEPKSEKARDLRFHILLER